jgi:hypothetical protein
VGGLVRCACLVGCDATRGDGSSGRIRDSATECNHQKQPTAAQLTSYEAHLSSHVINIGCFVELEVQLHTFALQLGITIETPCMTRSHLGTIFRSNVSSKVPARIELLYL